MKIPDTLVHAVLGFAVLLFLLYRPAAQLISRQTTELSQQTTEHSSAKTLSPTIKSPSEPASNKPLHGIDVSHYQGRIVWPDVKAAGIKFVYLKATDGISYTDPLYAHNTAALESLDMPFGAYHFFEPRDTGERQARHFLKQVNVNKGSLPPALDVETSAGKKPEEIQAQVKQWLLIVEKETGCKPIIYTYRDFWEKNLGDDFAEYPLWLAEYSDHPRLPKDVSSWLLWQHSSKGKVPGIETSVDLDVFAANVQELQTVVCNS